MIKITSQPALVGIDSQGGQLNIRQNQLPMELKTEAPKLHLQTEEAVLYIDQTQCFAEAGLKNNRDMSRFFNAEGRKAAMEAIARIASEGRQMTDIHRGEAIGGLAEIRSKSKEKKVNFDMIPKSRPEITVEEGKVTGYLERGSVEVYLGEFRPQIEYKPGKLEIYLRQKNFINIEYVGRHLDTYSG